MDIAIDAPETVEVETGPSPSASVIWLHGLGADGHDFEPVVPQLQLPPALQVRFVFPHAPVQPVTINGGMSMRSWYDILSLDTEGRADKAGVLKSSAMLDDLIARECARGIAADKIVIAGFSQGGAVAIQTALTSPHKLGGLMALSTYVALPEEVAAAAVRKDLPIFMAHGSFDPVLKLDWGRASVEQLTEAGFNVDWHEYPMAHAVCPQEIVDISRWLSTVLVEA